jgi:UDP-N-acetylmuramyl pentapeptide phosphotransferase/UDP-N-acetylglucosamine-1-phosphate transferase
MNSWQIAAVGLASAAVAIALVVTQRWHGRWTGDFEDSGVQKHHRGSPPRVGILPLIVGVLLGIKFLSGADLIAAGSASSLLSIMVLASLPVVLMGLADDLTKSIPPRVRLCAAVIAGLAAISLLGLRVDRVDVPLLDDLVAFWPVSVAITVLMVCGFTNAMNIIDGLNGLAGGLAVLMLCATAVVAAQMGDSVVLQLCLVLIMAVGGFLLLNFPRGMIFLGDGGAYFLGFMLVQIWLLLLSRNPSITPLFVVAVAFLPTMETIFSIYRRRYHGNRRGAAMLADRLHLHTLVYRRRALRLMRHLPWAEAWVANAAAAAALVSFGALPMLAAVFSPTSLGWALVVIGAAILGYMTWFGRMVGFKSGRSNVRSARPQPAARIT